MNTMNNNNSTNNDDSSTNNDVDLKIDAEIEKLNAMKVHHH